MVMSLPTPLAQSLGVVVTELLRRKLREWLFCQRLLPQRHESTARAALCYAFLAEVVGRLVQSSAEVTLSGQPPRCEEGRLPSLCVLDFKQDSLT